MADETSLRQPTEYEQKCVAEALREFSAMQAVRGTTETHWEEIAELIDPAQRNTFTFGSMTTPGEKKTERQIDATGMMALGRFTAICDSLLTPRNQEWQEIVADDDYVMKDRATRVWFEQVTKILFKYRYAAIGNFSAQNQAVFRNLGAYGTGAMFVDQFDSVQGRVVRGLRYKAVPVGELYIRENHQGLVDGFIRCFRLTADQAYKQFGKDNFPMAYYKAALDSHSQTKFMFIHRVVPRDDYDPMHIGPKSKVFASYYICLGSKTLLREGGYNTFPLTASRYEQTPNETYGRSPAMMVLPALKTLNAEKRVFLKQGHRAADPVLLTADDGIVGMNMRPGAMNPGGVTADGKLLVHTLPTGKIEITKEMMQEERTLIQDAFLVTLFQILTDTPTMTATEVIARTNEKGILIAPTMGRQNSEYLSPMTDRELDLLAEQGLLPPMPPRLAEANKAASYKIVATSPLAKVAQMQKTVGFLHTIESVKELVNITGDPSLLDPFNFDVAIPAIADTQGVPETWMASEDEVKGKRQNRAKQQQIQQQIQAAPAKAAMMKAAKMKDENAPDQGQMQPQQPQGMPAQ